MPASFSLTRDAQERGFAPATGTDGGARCCVYWSEHRGWSRRGRKASTCPQFDRNGGIEVTAGDRSERAGTGGNGESERERNTEQTDSLLRKGSGEDRAAATPEYEPERFDELRRNL